MVTFEPQKLVWEQIFRSGLTIFARDLKMLDNRTPSHYFIFSMKSRGYRVWEEGGP